MGTCDKDITMKVPANVGAMLYQSIVRYAEGGERVTRVVLPVDLFVEYQAEQGMVRMMSTMGVEILEGKVAAPKFYMGVVK